MTPDYSDQADLKTLIEKICYEGYKREDINDLIVPAFKKLKDETTYTRLLLYESRSFAKVLPFSTQIVKSLVLRKIAKMVEFVNQGSTQLR